MFDITDLSYSDEEMATILHTQASKPGDTYESALVIVRWVRAPLRARNFEEVEAYEEETKVSLSRPPFT